jgi:hypothetical protein
LKLFLLLAVEDPWGQLQRQILVMAVLVAGFLSLALLPLALVAPLLVERAQQASPPLQQR